MIKEFEGLDKEMLLKKANYLKGTDAEGWTIGDLVEKLVKNNCDLPVVSQQSELLAIKALKQIAATGDEHSADIAASYLMLIANCG